MAQQAERSHVRQIALPSPFRDRYEVIGVPQRLPATLADFPSFEKLASRRVIELPHVAP